MNKYRAKGIYIYVLGSIELFVGKSLKDSLRQVKGYQKKMTGIAFFRLADAHASLKTCICNPVPGLDKESPPSADSVRMSTEI